MRDTLSAILSASCSNLSPGLFTVIFICTPGTPDSRDGAKKLPAPARDTKGWRDDCVAVDDDRDDFSALVFKFSEPPFHPQHLPHPRQLDKGYTPRKPVHQNVVSTLFHLQNIVIAAARELTRASQKRTA